MKRLMVANWSGKNSARYTPNKMRTLLRCQIENALALGWSIEDIIFLANFEFQ